MAASRRGVVVLSSTPSLPANRYAQLWTGLVRSTGCRTSILNWSSFVRSAWGRQTVVHLQWPEYWIGSDTSRVRLAKTCSLTLLLALAHVRRNRVLYTVHNLPIQDRGLLDRVCERVAYRLATDVHVMSLAGFDEVQPQLGRLATKTVHEIPHLVYPALTIYKTEGARADRRTIAFFGTGRGYKGLRSLIDAFADTPSFMQLAIQLSSCNEATARWIQEAARRDSRIQLHFGFLSDEELEEFVAAVDLVVLPFARILNSGSVMQSLSLDRPVLVPYTATFADLGRRVGSGWVNTYEATLSAGDIEKALTTPRQPIDLEWCSDAELRTRIAGMLA